MEVEEEVEEVEEMWRWRSTYLVVMRAVRCSASLREAVPARNLANPSWALGHRAW